MRIVCGTPIKDLWKNHRWATLGAVAGIGVVLVALIGYLVLKRPADKSCPDPCTIETTHAARAR